MSGTSRSTTMGAFTELFRRVSRGPEGDVCAIEYGGGENHLVWKHPGKDFVCGARLLVQEGQEAVLFADGRALDRLGGGWHVLDGPILPLADRFFPGGLRPGAIYNSRVYFVNTATQLGIRWGTRDFLRLTDNYTRLPVSLGGGGAFNLRVKDSRRLVLKVAGAGTELLRERIFGDGAAGNDGLFREMFLFEIYTTLAEFIRDKMVDLADLDPWLPDISAAIRDALNPPLREYGLELPEFYVSRLFLDPKDPNTALVRGRHSDPCMQAVYAAERKKQIDDAEAEGEARARRTIWAARAEADRIQRESQAAAAARKLGGYSYDQETDRLVNLEAAKHAGGSCPWWEYHRYGGSWSYGPWGWRWGGPGGESSGPAGGSAGADPSGDWYCPNCRVPRSSRFCPDCGAERSEAREQVGTL